MGGVSAVRGDGGGAVHLRGAGALGQGGVHPRHEHHGLRRLPPGHRHRLPRPHSHHSQQKEDEGDEARNDGLLLDLRDFSHWGDGKPVRVLPGAASGVVVDGDGNEQPDTRDHLRDGSVSRARKGGRQESEELGQDIRHHRLRRRSHGHGVLQGPQAAQLLIVRRPEPSSPLVSEQQVGDGRPVPHLQQLLLVTLAHLAGANLQVVRGPPDAVGVDVLPVDAAVGGARLLPRAGRQRLEDPLPLRARLLPFRRRVWVRRDVLPAVVVHLGQGPSLLRHVQPALHRHHHRRRRRVPSRGATHRQLVWRGGHCCRAVHRAVGQSSGWRRQERECAGARP